MAEKVRTLTQLSARLASDPELVKQFKADPIQAVQQSTQSVLQTDVWIYRIVVCTLGAVVLLVAVGGMALILTSGAGSQQKALPEGVIALASTALGALAGLLAPAPSQS